MKHSLSVIALILLPAFASMAPAHSTTHEASAKSSVQSALSEGEVRKVDKEAKKLTIRHGPIANLDMPPMTMVFQVQDAAMLDTVKSGDKVRFNAEKSGGAFTVTHIETAK